MEQIHSRKSGQRGILFLLLAPLPSSSHHPAPRLCLLPTFPPHLRSLFLHLRNRQYSGHSLLDNLLQASIRRDIRPGKIPRNIFSQRVRLRVQRLAICENVRRSVDISHRCCAKTVLCPLHRARQPHHLCLLQSSVLDRTATRTPSSIYRSKVLTNTLHGEWSDEYRAISGPGGHSIDFHTNTSSWIGFV